MNSKIDPRMVKQDFTRIAIQARRYNLLRFFQNLISNLNSDLQTNGFTKSLYLASDSGDVLQNGSLLIGLTSKNSVIEFPITDEGIKQFLMATHDFTNSANEVISSYQETLELLPDYYQTIMNTPANDQVTILGIPDIELEDE